MLNAQTEKDKLIATATDASPHLHLRKKDSKNFFRSGGHLYQFQGPFLVKGKKTEAKDFGPENWQKSYRYFKGYL